MDPADCIAGAAYRRESQKHAFETGMLLALFALVALSGFFRQSYRVA